MTGFAKKSLHHNFVKNYLTIMFSFLIRRLENKLFFHHAEPAGN